MNTSAPSNIFLLKRSIDLSPLRQGFHIPPEFHALVYAALGLELHHGEGCDIQLMVEEKVFQVRMNNIDFDREGLCFEFANGVRETTKIDRHLRKVLSTNHNLIDKKKIDNDTLCFYR